MHNIKQNMTKIFTRVKKFRDIENLIRDFNSLPKRRNSKTVKQRREMFIKISKFVSPVFIEKYSTEHTIYF